MLFGEKCIIFVLAKRREPQTGGFSPFFGPRTRFFTSELKFFLGVSAKFLGVSAKFLGAVCARGGFIRIFCGPEIIKDIKNLYSEKVGF